MHHQSKSILVLLSDRRTLNNVCHNNIRLQPNEVAEVGACCAHPRYHQVLSETSTDKKYSHNIHLGPLGGLIR